MALADLMCSLSAVVWCIVSDDQFLWCTYKYCLYLNYLASEVDKINEHDGYTNNNNNGFVQRL